MTAAAPGHASSSGGGGCRICNVWKQLAAYTGGSRSSAAQLGPPAASSVLPGAQDRRQQAAAAATDCMGCRVTGLALGVGGGGYVASRLFEQPYPKGGHRFGLIAVSGGLFVLGIARAIGF
jgi:hypothetical protein